MAYLQYIIPAAALIIVQLIISFGQNNINNVRHELTVKEIKDDTFDLDDFKADVIGALWGTVYLIN